MRVKLKHLYELYQTLQVNSGNFGASIKSVRVLAVVVGWMFCVFALGTMQQGNVCDKVMSYITLFSSDRGYYRGNIRILWKYPRSVDIIRIT